MRPAQLVWVWSKAVTPLSALAPLAYFLQLSDAYQPDAASAVHSFCHAVPDTWHQMGVILAASDAMSWFGRVLGATPEDMTAELGPLQAPSNTLFLPYLGGERTPHNDSVIRASFLNLDHGTDRHADDPCGDRRCHIRGA